MKKLVILLALIALPIMASAQVYLAPTEHFIDSTGTANTHWQKIDLLSATHRVLETINDGTANLKVATVYGDTAAGNTRYQTTVRPGESLPIWIDGQYFYIKATTGTCAYRVRSYFGPTGTQRERPDSTVVYFSTPQPTRVVDSVLTRFSTPQPVYQKPVTQFADSSGTATVYWQTVDMLTTDVKRLEALNDGSVSLSVALNAADTVGTSSINDKYRKTVKPSEGLKFISAVRYIFIKAASSTCAYRIGTY